MRHWPILSLSLLLLLSVAFVGCGGDELRRVEETDEFSFDQMAAEAARETEASENGESDE